MDNLAQDLHDLILEYHMVLEQEYRARVDGYFQSTAQTITQREWDSKRNALEPSCEAIKLRGEIEARRVLLDASNKP